MSHGARWNRVPLSSAEKTLGDYLRPFGINATLTGKCHVLPDNEFVDRAGIEIESERHEDPLRIAHLRMRCVAGVRVADDDAGARLPGSKEVPRLDDVSVLERPFEIRGGGRVVVILFSGAAARATRGWLHLRYFVLEQRVRMDDVRCVAQSIRCIPRGPGRNRPSGWWHQLEFAA